MIRWCGVALTVVAVLGGRELAFAQTPPPAPLGVHLGPGTGGAAELTWDDRGPTPSRYSLDELLEPADGADPANEYRLAVVLSGVNSYALPRELPGVLPGRCYTLRFTVTAQYDSVTPDRTGSVGQAACGVPESRPFANDGHTEYVGAPFQAPLPPPAPPSDVRLVRDGAGWQLEWRDNSSDEAQFQPGVIIVGENGGAIASVTLPPLRRDTTVLELPQRITSDPPPAPGCYIAKLYVFAVGLDGGTTLPGNAEAPICVEGTLIRFPDAGDGTAATGADSAVRLAAIVSVLGAMLALVGIRIRLRV
jgi:hypothetical protein